MGKANERAVIQLASENLSKSFGSLSVLRGVDLAVERGQVVTLIGPSGSGKSTLLRCLNLLEQPDAGKLLWEGESIDYQKADEATLSRHRARIGMVFQHFHLFPHLTALENIVEAPIQVRQMAPSEARHQAQNLLERVGLADKADSYPSQLSGGQKQRVAIARSLAMEPAAILLDEVTSALDVEMVAGINQLLSELAQTMTMVAVTHDLGFARAVSDVIHFLDQGQIVESGPPERLLNQPENQRTQAFLEALG